MQNEIFNYIKVADLLTLHSGSSITLNTKERAHRLSLLLGFSEGT